MSFYTKGLLVDKASCFPKTINNFVNKSTNSSVSNYVIAKYCQGQIQNNAVSLSNSMVKKEQFKLQSLLCHFGDVRNLFLFQPLFQSDTPKIIEQTLYIKLYLSLIWCMYNVFQSMMVFTHTIQATLMVDVFMQGPWCPHQNQSYLGVV